MQSLIALTVRELKAWWYSPIASVVGALFLLLQGVAFAVLVMALNDPRIDPSWTIAQFFFGGWWVYWLAVFFMAPLVTMRTFSEEKRTGTIEMLLTAPVTDAQVVLSKFLGAWLVYALLWAATIVFFLFLRTLTPFDWGPILTGYLGTWLLGTLMIAIGVLTSSLTRNQVIAAVLAYVILLLFYFVGILDFFVRDPDLSTMIKYLSLFEHLNAFAKGIIDTRPIVFYLSTTALCLFLAGRVIGSPRWRT
jgi:ABC-2 type transport system permease protein